MGGRAYQCSPGIAKHTRALRVRTHTLPTPQSPCSVLYWCSGSRGPLTKRGRVKGGRSSDSLDGEMEERAAEPLHAEMARPHA